VGRFWIAWPSAELTLLELQIFLNEPRTQMHVDLH